MRAAGAPAWLAAGAERSLGAVFDRIPASESDAVKEKLLRMVAEKLFAGYRVESVRVAGDEVSVSLVPSEVPPSWSIEIAAPQLQPPASEWFARDTEGMDVDLTALISGVPLGALSWGDIELKNAIEDVCAAKLPGWRVSLLARSPSDEEAVLQVSFTAEQPVALAVTPRINSSSIPTVLYSELKDDLLEGFAPVIGVPVPWLDAHKNDLADWSAEILAGKSLVEQTVAVPTVKVTTGPLSTVDVDLESRRYAIWVWLAAYAGTNSRYAELGLHLGRRAQIVSGWDVELYGEAIVAANDWSVESRLGMRWSPWGDVWLGAEWGHPDDKVWFRLSIDPRVRKPYVWVRFSDDSDFNGGLGYRVDEHFAVELHYDNRDEDEFSIRAIFTM